MATGVLVVGINRATRLLGHLMLTEKSYDATVRLGVATTTDDAEGEVTSSTTARFDEPGPVESAFAQHVGEILQVPTSVSAIKVGGKRAYQRVRDGEEVALAARPVTVHSLEVLDQRVHGDWLDVDIALRCSSGTYVRAIARDVGAELGVGGHLTALRRTAVGPFGLAAARTLEQLAEDFAYVDISVAARSAFPAYDLDPTQSALVRVGRKLPLDLPAAGPVAVFDPEGEFLALYERGGDLARPVAVFV
ncbi:MAG: tRNA pseudouridine(55) synthase TruB, partial [Marmoricola sp.]